MNDAERLATLTRSAAELVQNDMTIGLGSGSTAEAFIVALGKRVAAGLRVRGVSTSERTTRKAGGCGIELVTFAEAPVLDLGVDGADEIDPSLNLVKGRGGALLYEKIVADACSQWVIVASSEKLVDRLGSRIPLPVEVVRFGWELTARAIRELGLEPHVRQTPTGDMFVTDGGHLILDCQLMPIDDPVPLANCLKALTGVVEHGIFIGLADMALTIDPEGVVTTRRRADRPGAQRA